MIEVGFFFENKSWPWERQFPNGDKRIDEIKFNFNLLSPLNKLNFFFDDYRSEFLTRCPFETRVLIVTEPKMVKKYSAEVLAKYRFVISPFKEDHDGLYITHALLPWHYGVYGSFKKSFSNLLKSPDKTQNVSIVCSDKQMTAEQVLRLDFFKDLKKLSNGQIDFFGRGSAEFEDKSLVLENYRLHIVLENTTEPNFWTEKISDSFLAESFPLYFGCSNLEDFFEPNSFERLDIMDSVGSFNKIMNLINDVDFHSSRLPYIKQSKEKVMFQYNTFTSLAKLVPRMLNDLNGKGFEKRNVPLSFKKLLKRSVPYLILKKSFFKLKSIIRTIPLTSSNANTDADLSPHSKWLSDNGETKLLNDFSLSEDSVVFDVGGYKGDWAALINEKYKSDVYIFEPVPDFLEFMRIRFRNNMKIHIHTFGLSSVSKWVDFSLSKDASQELKNSSGSLEIRDIDDVLKSYSTKFGKIDLIKINIEGAEYDLISRLISTDKIKDVKVLLVQFHLFDDPHAALYADLVQSLSRTHDCFWKYPFVWECWTMKYESKS